MFDEAFALIVGVEGKLSLDPSDPGNWTGGRASAGMLRGTKYGISAAAFPQLDIQNVQLDQAKQIYKLKYWDILGLDSQPWAVALLKFDAAVNQGQNWAKTLSNDPFDIALTRAMRYIASDNFVRDGKGWIARLLKIYTQAIKPTSPVALAGGSSNGG